MNRNALYALRVSLFSLLILSVLGYSLFQAQKLISGPKIIIDSPQNGATASSPFIEITGRAQNASYIRLNGKQIFTDISGKFSEKLLLSPGYNILLLDAKDKFGKTVSKKLELILKEY